MDDLPGEGLDNKNSKRIPLPTFIELLVIGSILGLLQGITVKEEFRMWDVPIVKSEGGGGMIFDILFFFCGCLAKKNDWLEELMDIN